MPDLAGSRREDHTTRTAVAPDLVFTVRTHGILPGRRRAHRPQRHRPGLGSHALQGDLRFADVLSRMGVDVIITPESVTVTGPANAELHGITVNMRDISDTMPTLAAIAPFADGPVRIEDVYNTRVKECDRLEACAENLRAVGVPVQVGHDWIEIGPAQPHAAHIACHGDHRIAMAFSITGLRTPGITLDDPGCVKKTYPGFHTALAALQNAWEHD